MTLAKIRETLGAVYLWLGRLLRLLDERDTPADQRCAPLIEVAANVFSKADLAMRRDEYPYRVYSIDIANPSWLLEIKGGPDRGLIQDWWQVKGGVADPVVTTYTRTSGTPVSCEYEGFPQAREDMCRVLDEQSQPTSEE
jgi:hypothetical protein